LKTRVLIVDDEPIARRGIRRYLAEHDGIELVGEATNGINAVEQINELHPDIVFLDVQMPDLDGFGVIENVEPSTGPAPVYMSSSLLTMRTPFVHLKCTLSTIS
jgi:two-component system, LytTR family, response regulator